MKRLILTAKENTVNDIEINAHIRYVIPYIHSYCKKYATKYANQYRGDNQFHEELVSAGMLGAWKAAKAFDKSKGFAFITYAHKEIAWAISHHMRTLYTGKALANTIDSSEFNDDLYLSSGRMNIENTCALAEMIEQVNDHFITLPQKQQECLYHQIASFGEDKEIAKTLGIAKHKFSDKVCKAKRTLKQKMFGEEAVCF